MMDTLMADKATRKDHRLFIEEEPRTRYIVRPGDTLESIARKILHDKRLALLIFRINRSVIRVEYREGNQIVHLKPNTVLQMPTRTEIEIFRATIGSKKMSNKSAAFEETTRINYTVRLGDTLRTVAMRHAALKDATLWRLIAEINGLSTELDADGTPVAKVLRETTLRLPTSEEIDSFRKREHQAVQNAV
jgi:nucleoid-associated protein YgaU